MIVIGSLVSIKPTNSAKNPKLLRHRLYSYVDHRTNASTMLQPAYKQHYQYSEGSTFLMHNVEVL